MSVEASTSPGSTVRGERYITITSSPPLDSCSSWCGDGKGNRYGVRMLRVSGGVLRAWDSVADAYTVHFQLCAEEIAALQDIRINGLASERALPIPAVVDRLAAIA